MRLKTGGCFAEEYANNENNGKGAVTQTKKSFVRQPHFFEKMCGLKIITDVKSIEKAFRIGKGFVIIETMNIQITCD